MTATVCVVKGGVTSELDAVTLSIADYCYAVLEGDYADEFKTVA